MAHVCLVEDVPQGSPTPSFLQSNTLRLPCLFLYCPSTQAYEGPEEVEAPKGVIWMKFTGNIDSPSAQIVAGIHEFLLSDEQELCTLSTELLDMPSLLIRQDDLSVFAVLNKVQNLVDITLNQVSITDLRKSFKLQHSFQVEAAAELEEAENVPNYMDTKVGKTIVAYKQYQECCNRKKLSGAVADLPVIKLFLTEIASSTAVERIAFISCLDNAIRTAIQPTLNSLLEELKMVEDQLEGHQENAVAKYRQNQLRVLFSLTTCHLEHIWRELSHRYVADPIRFYELQCCTAHVGWFPTGADGWGRWVDQCHVGDLSSVCIAPQASSFHRQTTTHLCA
jgi:hypothetical protein